VSFESICIVGQGRVGTALAARLEGRLPVKVTKRQLECADADLVLLCVPDRAIGGLAARIEQGPWVAHTSGATTLAELAPHDRRFSVHPLQTFSRSRGAEQLDGAWAAVTSENSEASKAGHELAGLLGLRPFELPDEERALYHAAATVAAGFLVTLHEAAAELMRAAGAPPEALEPLMRRTMDNGFSPTGPHARGDWETVERHLAEIRERRPDLERLYETLSELTVELAR